MFSFLARHSSHQRDLQPTPLNSLRSVTLSVFQRNRREYNSPSDLVVTNPSWPLLTNLYIFSIRPSYFPYFPTDRTFQMMLSQAMHQYAPSSHFQSLPSSNGDVDPSTGMPHQSSVSAVQKATKQARHHPYYSPQNNGRRINGIGQMNWSTLGPIRRRISRACDQCNQLRTKCDGKLPCQHYR